MYHGVYFTQPYPRWLSYYLPIHYFCSLINVLQAITYCIHQTMQFAKYVVCNQDCGETNMVFHQCNNVK